MTSEHQVSRGHGFKSLTRGGMKGPCEGSITC